MTRWRAIVDRIEDKWAVLVPEEEPSIRLLLARKLLPSGIRDGSLLLFRVELEDASQKKEEIVALQRELEERRENGDGRRK
ncbi:MAG: DUF3006 family protein [Bacillota bacterium]